MGCFNFERVKVLIFRFFGRCFKPTMWDGDKSMKPFEVMKRHFSCSKPTGWDGDSLIATPPLSFVLFRAHRVEWRLLLRFNPSLILISSEPTGWDGD